MNRIKLVKKTVIALLMACVFMSSSISAYASYYDGEDFWAGSYVIYAEAFVNTSTRSAGATANSTVDTDYRIEGTAWDLFGIPKNFSKSADQTTYVEVSVRVYAGANLMKEVEATVEAWSPDGYNSQYVHTIDPYIS